MFIAASAPAPAAAQINGGDSVDTGGGGFGGGNGGSGISPGGNGTGGNGATLGGGGAGVGGAGGSFAAPGSGTIASFTNSGTISGGNGGAGGGGGAGIGGGGSVGLGVLAGGAAGFTIGDNTITNTSTGTITGGNGGGTVAGLGGAAGGAGIGRGGRGFDGGTGGLGLNSITIINAGAITGGNGTSGAGGAGINGSSLTVINSGSITGGLASDGITRANAITFFGGTNTFELRAGSIITGNVVDQTNNGTFRLGGATDSTFDVSNLGVAYQGFASFEKTGASNWTLTGTSTYAGPININGGMLRVDGDITSTSGVTVNSGGTLGGTGTLPTTVIAGGGTLAPGNSVGTINVQSNLTFNAGSTYRVEVDGATADRTNVTGTANLGGTLLVVPAARITTRTTYTIINAAAYTGAFAAMTVNNLSLGRIVGNGINGNDFEITLDVGGLVLPASIPGNQSNVGNAINNAIIAGANPPAGFGTLLGLTGTQLTNALSQVSGEGGNGATQQTSFTATSQFIGTILDPSIDGRGGDAGGSATGYADEGSEALAYAGKRKATPSERDAYAAVTPHDARRDHLGARWSVWASGYGGSSSVSGNAAAGTNSTSSSIYGTAVGADYRVGRDTLVGFAMGGGGTHFSTAQGLGKGRADLFQAGVYGRQGFGAAYVSGALAYGWQDVTLDRTVTVAGTDQLRSRFQAQSLAARLEGGYRFATALMGVTPYGALQATRVHSPGYSEFAVSGSNQFALAFASQNTNNLRSELGVRGDKSFAVQHGTLTLRSRVAWAHDSNTSRTVNPTFQSLPGSAFTVNGARPAADGALLSAGAEMKWRNGWSVAGMFEGEFSRTTESYAGKGTVKYTW